MEYNNYYLYKILKKIFCFSISHNSYEFCLNYVDTNPYSYGLKYQLFYFHIPIIEYELWKNKDNFKKFYFYKLEQELKKHLYNHYGGNNG